MKKNMRRHIAREIRGTLNRFVAIFAITALGAGFFAGLRATGPDMRATADKYYADQHLQDIRLLSTFGFTEDDIQAIRTMDGVNAVMPTYGIDLLVEAGESFSAVRLHALPADTAADNPDYLNQIILNEGRMPAAAHEALADVESGYRVGDTIRLADNNDADSLELMAVEAFTVVGIATSPYYISFGRGNTNIGNGTLDSYLYLTEAAFDSEYYLEVLLTLTDAKGLSAFSGEYETLADDMVARFESFGGSRAQIRYEEILAEYTEEIEDGQRELDDKRTEVDEELADAWQELQDAQGEIEDAKRELADGRVEIADARQTLVDAQAEITSAEAELADGRATLDSGEAGYRDGVASYEDGMAQYIQGLAEYENGYTLYQQGLDAYNLGYAQYQVGLAEYNSQRADYDAALAQLAGLVAAAAGLEGAAGDLAALLPAIGTGQTPEEQAALAAFLEGAYTASATLRALAGELAAAGMTDEAAGLAAAADGMEAYLAAGLYAEAVGVLAGAAGNLTPALAAARAGLDAALPQLEAARATLDASAAELAAAKDELDASAAELMAGKQVLDESLVQLEDAKGQLDSARSQLSGGWRTAAEGEAELAAAKRELAEGWAELRDAEAELAEGEQELADGIQDYEDGLAEYHDGVAEAEQEFADAQREIDDAKQELADLELPEWYVYDRSGNPGYSGLGSNVDRISAIATLIPYFFFLVAALVCLTTMTRMVEEQRTGIGTFKALGFGRGTIAAKFLLYAGLASFTGSAVGVAVGLYLFPGVIWDAYGMMYVMPPVTYAPQPLLVVQSVAAMVLITVAATFSTCWTALRSVPAELMRPKPPQKGTRVWLEHLPFIWNRMKFSHKVTVRNLFRYKKRFFMTVVGVAGCTALLLTGFGLDDALGGLVAAQYGEVDHYSLTLVLTQPASAGEESTLNEALANLGEAVYVQQFAIEAESETANNAELTTYLYVAERPGELSDFITFNDVENSGQIPFPANGGVVVTEKLANWLGVSAGDAIRVNRANEAPAEVEIAGVAENYVYHYVYMTPEVYTEVTGEAPEYDRVLVRLADENANPAAVLETLLEDGNVAGGVHFAYIRDEFEDQMGSLTAVVWLIIGCAGLLAFVVLYNLTNINITERAREIATLKVLGFFEGEVAGYVYRENILLTCIGMVAGLGLGIVLHRYVITTAEVDEVMFQRVIKPMSYLLSMLFTLLCAGIVNLVMLGKLKGIDMVESLKSAE